MITTLRAAGIQPVHLPITPERTITIYPLEGAGLDQLEHAIERVGLHLYDDTDDHGIPTNTIKTQGVLGNDDGIVIELEPPPGEGGLELPWSARVGGFAVYSDLLVEIDGLTESDACFDDGEDRVWLHASANALSRPTTRTWAAQEGREVSWRGTTATVQGARHGVVWLRCGQRLIGVAPEEVDPMRW